MRLRSARVLLLLVLISIHAPAWGATSFESFKPRSPFQFTHPRGVRRLVGNFNAKLIMFQFTHPRGVRRSFASSSDKVPSKFQFTHPRGVRLSKLSKACATRGVSIHAPAWGATSRCRFSSSLSLVSIHAPAWGATRKLITAFFFECKFKFTHPRGVRRVGTVGA